MLEALDARFERRVVSVPLIDSSEAEVALRIHRQGAVEALPGLGVSAILDALKVAYG